MNTETETDYKQTKAGVVPSDWDVCALETLGSGGVPPVKAGPFGSAITKDMYVRNGYKVYGQEQVIRDDPRYGDYFVDEAKYRELSNYRIAPGDVLLSLVGTLGKTLVVPKNAADGIINPRLLRLSLDPERVSPFFLKQLFESEDFQSTLSRYAQGGTMSILNATILRSVEIPLPPLPEQRAIADALSGVDALIERLDALIAKKRAIKTATMQRLLTGQQRLPGFDGAWTTKRLGEIGSTYGGLTGKTKKNFGTGSALYVPFLNIMNNVTIDLDQLEKVEVFEGESQNSVQKGDLFFNTSSETPEEVGMCATLRDNIKEVYLNSFCFGFRLYDEAGVDNLFLTYLFRSKVGRELIYSLAQGATRYNLSKSNFVKLEIDFPNPEEQEAIATILSDMDAEIEALQARRDKTQDIKQGMMQELLTGRTRLV